MIFARTERGEYDELLITIADGRWDLTRRIKGKRNQVNGLN